MGTLEALLQDERRRRPRRQLPQLRLRDGRHLRDGVGVTLGWKKIDDADAVRRRRLDVLDVVDGRRQRAFAHLDVGPPTICCQGDKAGVLPWPGMLMLGKMSVGVVNATSGPKIMMTSARTAKVYGRRSCEANYPHGGTKKIGPRAALARRRTTRKFWAGLRLRAGGHALGTLEPSHESIPMARHRRHLGGLVPTRLGGGESPPRGGRARKLLSEHDHARMSSSSLTPRSWRR